MSEVDLVVRGGALVLRDGVRSWDVAVADGRIVEIGADLGVQGREEIDAGGLHVFPGGVDPHVHFDEPGRTDWEGFQSGTEALAAGGVTTFIDMPLNCTPVTCDGSSFELKRQAAEASALVDFALWGGLTPLNVERLDELADHGVAGLKAFMCDSGIKEFPAADDFTLFEGMTRAAELGLLVAVHAENDALTQGLAARVRRQGHVRPRDYVASRPPIAEIEAIQRAVLLAEEAGCALHIVHVSTVRGIMLIERARRRGVDVTCETCPHYLLFTAEDLDELGASGKCLPPLRSEADRLGLWELVEDGTIPIVASDHSPAPPDLKTSADFFEIWGGIAGCQSALQLLLAAQVERGIALERIAAVLAANAAGRFRLPGKGAIEAGNDADLVLVDLASASTLRAADLRYRYATSAFLGSRVRGRIDRVLLRGISVMTAGRRAGAACGRLVVPSRRPVGATAQARVGAVTGDRRPSQSDGTSD